MNLKDLRSQFSVFIFFPTSDENTEMKGALIEAGYESFLFVDQVTMISRIKDAAPHVVLFSPDALQDSLSEFVTQVLEINAEVQFVCVAPAEQSDTLNEYREYNFAAMVPQGPQVAVRSVWALDQVCQNLYRLYQNERLLDERTKLKTDLVQMQGKLKEAAVQKPTAPVTQIEFSLAEKIRSFQGAHSKDEYLQAFLKQIPCMAIFFKFLPTVNSFVATYAKGLEIESIKGVGSRLKPEELEQLIPTLQAGKLPAALNELMQEGLKVKKYFSRPVMVHRGLDGLLIFWGNENFHIQAIENQFMLFLLLYQQAHLIKRNEGFDIYDPVTELYNRNYFVQKLEEEIARARRIQKPVSVVRLSVDHFVEIEQSYGRSNRDLLMRTMASIVKKTSRVNDLSCRTEDNEFSLILPHCARKGAALRAERLRRIIEGHSFGVSDLKVTISCGVSEYPSLSSGAADLESSASKALEFIVSRGGNKVCLFKPVDEFKPDFEVPPM
jgi:diguanylate cyclase (GGDEF)-like protein